MPPTGQTQQDARGQWSPGESSVDNSLTGHNAGTRRIGGCHGLPSAPQSNISTCYCLGPEKITAHAKDVIEFRILSGRAYPSLCGWALSTITCILIKEKQAEFWKRRKQHVHRIRTRVKWPQARESWSYQKLKETKNRFILRTFGGSLALPKPWFQASGL